MGRTERKGVSEINLTSLLDVLFCILFIVMMTSVQSEERFKNEAKQEIEQLQNQIESYNLYQNEAVIITLSNIVEENTHQLLISEKESTESILLGTNRTEGTRERLKKIIIEKLEIAKGHPIYIVFHCAREDIYTEEYNAIKGTLLELQEENKEIFYKDMGEEE